MVLLCLEIFEVEGDLMSPYIDVWITLRCFMSWGCDGLEQL